MKQRHVLYHLTDNNEVLAVSMIELATDEEAEILNKKIDAFNAKQLLFSGNVEELQNYVIKETDQKRIIAGIRICLYLNECMFISVLFVDEEHRNKGLGSRLLQHVELYAKSRNIKLIHLDTFDFQAKDFYLKRGYSIFGILENAPKGHCRYYMKKEL